MLRAFLDRAAREPEAFRYAPIKALAQTAFAPALAYQGTIDQLPSVLAAGDERHRLVFVDGALRRDLCLLGGWPEDTIVPDPDGGLRIRFDRETCLALAPLELVFLSTAQEKAGEHETPLVIELGASGRLTLIEHHVALAGDVPVVAGVREDIRLGAHAKLVHGRLLSGFENHRCLARTQVTVAGGAYYDALSLHDAQGLTRDEIAVTLSGPEAQARIRGLLLLAFSAHLDLSVNVTHAAAGTLSRQVHRLAAMGRAQGAFQGKIAVAPGAQKIDAHQLTRGLLLSDASEIDIKPELEIFADDVKCSHGAAVGKLDGDALFYLQSRGVPEKQARALLTEAFCAELISDFAFPAFGEECQRRLAAWLEGLSS